MGCKYERPIRFLPRYENLFITKCFCLGRGNGYWKEQTKGRPGIHKAPLFHDVLYQDSSIMCDATYSCVPHGLSSVLSVG